jgi:hypothetical protein
LIAVVDNAEREVVPEFGVPLPQSAGCPGGVSLEIRILTVPYQKESRGLKAEEED